MFHYEVVHPGVLLSLRMNHWRNAASYVCISRTTLIASSDVQITSEPTAATSMFISHLQVHPHISQTTRSFTQHLEQSQLEATKNWFAEILQAREPSLDIETPLPPMFNLPSYAVSIQRQFGVLVCSVLSPKGAQVSSWALCRKSRHRYKLLDVLAAKFDLNLSGINAPPAPWLGRIDHDLIDSETRRKLLNFEACAAWALCEYKQNEKLTDQPQDGENNFELNEPETECERMRG